MQVNRGSSRVAATAVVLLLSLGACGTGVSDDEDSDLGADDAAVSDEIIALDFSAPADCTVLLPESAVASLAQEGIELVQGPGSPSAEPIFVEGQTPEELVGGLSCLYSVPGQEDTGVYIILSVAPVTEDVRPGIITDLLAQKLNVGQSPDGALTYWIWGDDVIVPALHNALYQDSWYSALLQPGGRPAYDKGVSLVQSMRTQTTP